MWLGGLVILTAHEITGGIHVEIMAEGVGQRLSNLENKFVNIWCLTGGKDGQTIGP
jgi:hypothetical protein